MGMSNVWKPLSVVSGLLLLLTYLLIQSRSPDLALRARLQENLQTLQLPDTELTRDVWLVRAGLLPHDDSLPRTGQSLSRTLATLRAEPSRNRRMMPSFPPIARDTSSPGIRGRRRSSAMPLRKSWARPSRS
jgi:hypothetical protein